MSWTLHPGELRDTANLTMVVGLPVIVPVAADGSWTVTVRATDDPTLTAATEEPLRYEVTYGCAPHVTTWEVEVPAPGPWAWEDLLQN